MRNNFRFMMGIAAIAMGFASAPAAMMDAGGLPEADGVLGPRRHRGKGHNNLRGRGKVDKPRKRSNRLTISKRVRNKHRKAARR
jgi:hypothetical protein